MLGRRFDFATLRRMSLLGNGLIISGLTMGCTSGTKLIDARADFGKTYELSDKKVVVRVSPEIGRVVHFSRVGEPNLLWIAPESPAALQGQWQNFGGDKLWPWPQNPAWGWPPPKAIDAGPYTINLLHNLGRNRKVHSFVITAPDQKASRETQILPQVVSNRYTINGPTTQPVAAWSITQIPAVDDIYVCMMPNPPAEPTTQMSVKPVKTETINARWVKVIPDYTGTKIGLAGDKIAARIGDSVLVLSRTAGNDDPNLERQVAAQIYFHGGKNGVPDASTYIELELIGPTKRLGKGESTSLYTEWRILTVDEFEQFLKQ